MSLWFKPVSLVAGLTAGAVAAMTFRQTWKLVAGDDEAPDATDEERGWGEVIAAAAIQGAIFAIVRAAFDRGAAAGVRRLTGSWPS
ncbi:MAG TPA: DUF4235 domain-containing protein [Mycobacteriales bacterium]|jgi:hypothetical protein|nr:DUF4235 domain-containing protein [Mycobacteriales bacterium]